MKSGYKVLLFAHPRSGSSNIYEILQAHPELDILAEPFNENFVNWSLGNKDYRELVHDVASLEEQVAEILSQYDGFKLAGYQLQGDEVGGLPRSVEDDLLEHVLLRPDLKVVYVRRLNLLQAVVSNLIAHQTGVWTKWDMTRPYEFYYSNLAPLDITEVRSRIERLADHLDWCESVLDRRNDGSFRLVYEDFYFAAPVEQAERLSALWGFLGLEPIAASEFEYYLRPESTKLNSAATYAAVPNIEEVNERCGSDAHGWLFESPRRGGAV